jgi:ribosomal protein L31
MHGMYVKKIEGDFSRKMLKVSETNHKLYTGQNRGTDSEKNLKLKELY